MPRDIALNRGLSPDRQTVQGFHVLDQFNGVDATAITAHLPDVAPPGSAWAIQGSAPAATPNLSGNRLRIQDNGDGQTRWVEIESGEADCNIDLLLYMNSINPAWGGIMFRGTVSNRWHFRVEYESQTLKLYDPTGAAQSIAFAAAVSNVIRYEVGLAGSYVAAKAKNLNSGLEKIIENNGGLNRIATLHGVSTRNAFGNGASDFYEAFAVRAR